MSEKTMKTNAVPQAHLHHLVSFIHAAKKNLAHPKILLSSPDLNQKIQLTIAGAGAKVPGSINVTDGQRFGQNIWFGRISKTGLFEPAKHVKNETLLDDVFRALVSFDNNPENTAVAFGRKTQRCCFCSLPLKNKNSLAVGYGPICAENFSLPWAGMASQLEEDETLSKIRKNFQLSEKQFAFIEEKIIYQVLNEINLFEDSKQTAPETILKISQLLSQE